MTDAAHARLRASIEKLRISETYITWDSGYNHAIADVLALLDHMAPCEKERAVCKACGTDVLWHKRECMFICSECGRRDGSARLIETQSPTGAAGERPPTCEHNWNQRTIGGYICTRCFQSINASDSSTTAPTPPPPQAQEEP